MERAEEIVIACRAGRPLVEAIERAGHVVLPLSEEGAPVRESRRTPRLAVLQAGSPDAGPAVGLVAAVRRRWPLVDVLVLAPEATPATVRTLLRAGAHDVLLDAAPDEVAAALATALDAQKLLPMVDRLAERRVRSSRFEGLLSRSHAMWDVFETGARVAPTDANVLICGETGTGKELLARALHRLSRRSGRFVAVNCSSLPEHLVESELFGYEKGAFTGAVRASRGIFRHADGGTVLLDEIGDMPPAAQQSLLRVLETRTIRPVGGTEEVPVDVRIVAATHVPLDEAVAEGAFREDLFYRLDVIRLDLPPLRDRPEDVVYLFGHFVKSLARHYGVDRPVLGDDFLAEIAGYEWPGNVRELENVAERIVLRGRPGPLGAADVAPFLRLDGSAPDLAPTLAPPTTPATTPPTTPATSRPHAVPAEGPDRAPASPSGAAPGPIDPDRPLVDVVETVVADVERRYLEAMLRRTGGRVQEAARRAGISRRTLQRKMQRYDIDKARFRRRG